jgi:hypothetical protein
MKKKLHLKRQKVRFLSSEAVARVAGGATATCAGFTSYVQKCQPPKCTYFDTGCRDDIITLSMATTCAYCGPTAGHGCPS